MRDGAFWLKNRLRLKLRGDLPEGAGLRHSLTLPHDRLKIGAVQWQADPVERVQDWSGRVRALFAQAAATHCHMLVFPEYLPLSLLGVVMQPATVVSTLTDAAIARLLRILAPAVFEHWRRWMSALSREFGLATIAGSGLTLYQGQLINVALGFNTDGRLTLWQPKWHPLPSERRWGVSSGPISPLPIMEPWGLTALVSNDATYFESFRIAQSRGAHIVAVPMANPEPRHTLGKARRGCFSQVQDVPLAGVVAASTGQLFGLRLTGKAGIYLPGSLTPDGSGILAESPHPVGEGLVSGLVSLSQVSHFQEEQSRARPIPPPDFMKALYQFEEDPPC